MTVQIEWYTYMNNGFTNRPDIDISSTQSLDRVSVDIVNNYPNYQYYQCPAFQDSLKDTFILRSPVDISIRINKKNNIFQVASSLQEIIINRPSEDTKYQSFSFTYLFNFISKHDDIMLEQLPAFYHKNDFTDKCQIIIGQFNIGKWIRPIQLGDVVVTTDSEEDIFIHIKRGDAISYVRFKCKDDMKLNRLEDIDEIYLSIQRSEACTRVKQFSPKLSLKKLYDIFKPFNQKYKKSCPFNIFKKGE
jgi:hypothetical protein